MRESCTEKKRGAKKGRIWKREKRFSKAAYRKEAEGKDRAGEKGGRCREEEEDREAVQRGQRGRCVKEK